MNSGIVCDVSRILQEYMKRQIISLIGDFQVIADLNVYHVFMILQRYNVNNPIAKSPANRGRRLRFVCSNRR